MSYVRVDLPSYTSERYFLLSEIENGCVIHTLASSAVPRAAGVCFLYCLWTQSNGSQDLMQTLATLHDFKTKNPPVVVIETYSPDVSDAVISSIYLTMAVIQSQFGGWSESIIVFALANDKDASPGLEYIYDCLHFTLPSADRFVVVAQTADAFMGNGRRDPDASEGVLQCLLTNTESPVQSVATRFGLELRTVPESIAKKGSSRSFFEVVVILVGALFLVVLYEHLLATTVSVYLARDS